MSKIRILSDDDNDGQLFIGCVGYETRSVEGLKEFLRSSTPDRALIFDYASEGAFYSKNKEFMLDNQVLGIPCFEDFLRSIEKLLDARSDAFVLDVSSMDREKIARILQTFFHHAQKGSSLKLIYYPSAFYEPKRRLEEVKSFGPVTPAFIGVSNPSLTSTKLILGAGFEYGRAVSAIDLLEPSEVFCYFPVGTDPRFEASIRSNNLDFSFLEPSDQLLSYDLMDPRSLFYELMSSLANFVEVANVIILPLGPKIFAAISILAALCHHPEVMVWRHSVNQRRAGENDIVASGKRVCLTVGF